MDKKENRNPRPPLTPFMSKENGANKNAGANRELRHRRERQHAENRCRRYPCSGGDVPGHADGAFPFAEARLRLKRIAASLFP